MPINGFKCRCRTGALSKEDVERRGLTVESGKGNLVSQKTTVGGQKVTVRGYKDPVTGEELYPDPGFDYNPGKEPNRQLTKLLKVKLGGLPAPLRNLKKLVNSDLRNRNEI